MKYLVGIKADFFEIHEAVCFELCELDLFTGG